jgi:hypothetical protein
MAEKPIVHIGENSPEHIAYKLMLDINRVERRDPRSKDEVLNLYAECLETVRNPTHRATETRSTS